MNNLTFKHQFTGFCKQKSAANRRLVQLTADARQDACVVTLTPCPCSGRARRAMDSASLTTMDKDALRKQIDNLKYQASMERWTLSKSIAA